MMGHIFEIKNLSLEITFCITNLLIQNRVLERILDLQRIREEIQLPGTLF